MNTEVQVLARKCEALDHAPGPVVLQALADTEVVQVLANPDDRLVIACARDGQRPASPFDIGV